MAGTVERCVETFCFDLRPLRAVQTGNNFDSEQSVLLSANQTEINEMKYTMQ